MPNSVKLIKILRYGIIISICLVISLFSLNIDFLDYTILANRPVQYVTGLKTIHIIANILLIFSFSILGIYFIKVYFTLRKNKVAFAGFLWMFGVLKLVLVAIFIMNFVSWWRMYYWIDGIIRISAGLISLSSMIAWLQVYKFISNLKTPAEYEKLANEIQALRKIQDDLNAVKVKKSKNDG